jgi:excinuclease ABC subunit A
LKRGSGRLTVPALPVEESGRPAAGPPQGGAAPSGGSEPHEVGSVGASSGEVWKFSTGLHCPESDIRYADPIPSMFSFNSAVGACETCRGFGRVIGVDLGLVIPNDKLTLRAGAIKTIQTPAWKEAQDDLMRHAETAGIPRDTPWYKLTPEQQAWVIEGSPHWNGKWNQQWYGVRRFFGYLETKAYKMHIRVLLSKYRSYTPCPACGGARLKLESLLWRIGSKADADAVLEPSKRFMPVGVKWSRERLEALPGLCLHDLMLLPIERVRRFFDRQQQPSPQPSPARGRGRGNGQPGAGDLLPLPLAGEGRGEGGAFASQRLWQSLRRALTPALSHKWEREKISRERPAPQADRARQCQNTTRPTATGRRRTIPATASHAPRVAQSAMDH